MKDFIIYPLAGIILAILVIWAYGFYGNRLPTPIVDPDGKISGEYAILSIMELEKPYVCAFEKADEVSKISGTIYLENKKLYGEFKIKTDIIKEDFNSFLIIKDEEAYIWTALQNIGYRSKAAKSASHNASPNEQAQIIGLEDIISYKCEIWTKVDQSKFTTPNGIKFDAPKL